MADTQKLCIAEPAINFSKPQTHADTRTRRFGRPSVRPSVRHFVSSVNDRVSVVRRFYARDKMLAVISPSTPGRPMAECRVSYGASKASRVLS